MTTSYAEARSQVERLDAQIDARVYELCGLTEKEVEIVEEAGRR